MKFVGYFLLVSAYFGVQCVLTVLAYNADAKSSEHRCLLSLEDWFAIFLIWPVTFLPMFAWLSVKYVQWYIDKHKRGTNKEE